MLPKASGKYLLNLFCQIFVKFVSIVCKISVKFLSFFFNFFRFFFLKFSPTKDQIETFYVDSYGIYRRRVNPKVVKILDFSSIGYSAIAEDIEILSFQGHPPSATEDAKLISLKKYEDELKLTVIPLSKVLS